MERALYHKGLGYTFDTEKVFQFQGDIVPADVVEHVPPSDTACIFWLKNRRKDKWRDRHEIEHDAAAESPWALAYARVSGTAIRPKDPKEEQLRAKVESESSEA